jgi:hypothetical protein
MSTAGSEATEDRNRLGRHVVRAVAVAWRNERARRGRGQFSCSATPIRANAVSENMSLNNRERAEGFLAVCRSEVANSV